MSKKIKLKTGHTVKSEKQGLGNILPSLKPKAERYEDPNGLTPEEYAMFVSDYQQPTTCPSCGCSPCDCDWEVGQ